MTEINTIIESNAKVIELSDGSSITMPKLTNKKVLQLAKLLTGDLSDLYYKVRNTVKTPIFYAVGTPKYDEQGAIMLDEEGNKVLHDGTTPVLDTNGEPLTRLDTSDVKGIIDVVLENLSDEMITKLVGILVGVDEQTALNMDVFDTILIVGEFLDNTNIHKAFLAINKVTDKFRPKPAKSAEQTSGTSGDPSKASVVPFTPTQTT